MRMENVDKAGCYLCLEAGEFLGLRGRLENDEGERSGTSDVERMGVEEARRSSFGPSSPALCSERELSQVCSTGRVYYPAQQVQLLIVYKKMKIELRL